MLCHIFHIQPLLNEAISLTHLPGWNIWFSHILHCEAISCVDALALRDHDVDLSLTLDSDISLS